MLLGAILDRVVGSDGKLNDFLRGRWLGHPLHPALTDVVIGSWTTACALDALAVLGTPGLQRATNISIGAGLVAAPFVAMTGLADWRHQNDRLRRTGLVHMGLNVLASFCYGASLSFRLRRRHGWGRLLSTAGYAIGSSSAWLGGVMAFSRELESVDAEATERPSDSMVA